VAQEISVLWTRRWSQRIVNFCKLVFHFITIIFQFKWTILLFNCNLQLRSSLLIIFYHIKIYSSKKFTLIIPIKRITCVKINNLPSDRRNSNSMVIKWRTTGHHDEQYEFPPFIPPAILRVRNFAAVNFIRAQMHERNVPLCLKVLCYYFIKSQCIERQKRKRETRDVWTLAYYNRSCIQDAVEITRFFHLHTRDWRFIGKSSTRFLEISAASEFREEISLKIEILCDLILDFNQIFTSALLIYMIIDDEETIAFDQTHEETRRFRNTLYTHTRFGQLPHTSAGLMSAMLIRRGSQATQFRKVCRSKNSNGRPIPPVKWRTIALVNHYIKILYRPPVQPSPSTLRGRYWPLSPPSSRVHFFPVRGSRR